MVCGRVAVVPVVLVILAKLGGGVSVSTVCTAMNSEGGKGKMDEGALRFVQGIYM